MVKPRSVLIGFVASVIAAVGATVVAWTSLGREHLADAVMVYLLATVIVSLRFGYVPSVLAAVSSVLCFNFFFIPPYYTLAVADPRHVVTFAVMLVVAVLISSLTRRVRDQAAAAEQRERRTARLYALSRELAAATTRAQIVDIGVSHARELVGGEATVERPGQESTLPTVETRRPLVGSRGVVGVLSVQAADSGALADADGKRQLDALASQLAAALERETLAEEAHRALLQIESEQLRNALLSSVSHDLRTPLAVVTGAASTLLESGVPNDVRRELTETILQEADRLNRLVQNLLDMTRLESGALRVRKQWHPLEEVIGVALDRACRTLGAREVTTSLPPRLTLVPVDALLIEQVLVNLLENAVKYGPPDAPIHVGARVAERAIEIEVADRGAGISPGDEVRVFEKFERGSGVAGRAGAGLGLTICRGIVLAHGGRIWIEPREGGGASVRFVLPIEGEPPDLVETERLAEDVA